MKTKELIKIAKKHIKNSHSPYSNFKVAAVLLTQNGKIYTGVNVENASFGLTICAERAAIFKAVSEGEKKFKILLIYVPTKKITPPCGACRQVIMEFSRNLKIIMTNSSGKIITKKINQLLPLNFSFKKEAR